MRVFQATLRSYSSIRPVLAALLIAIIPSPGTLLGAAQNTLTPPQGAHFRRFIASVSGAEATWINPAALGAIKYSTAGLQFGYRDDQFPRDWGYVAASHGFAYARRSLDDLYFGGDKQDYIEKTLAFGFGQPGQGYFGASYRYVSEGPEPYRNRHEWNVGFLGRSGGQWSYAATLENINKRAALGAPTSVRQKFGLGYRPLTSDRLTLNAELAWTHKQSLNDAALRLGVEGSPSAGVKLFGAVEEGRIDAGVSVNFERSYSGAQAHYDNGDTLANATAYVGVTSQRQESALPPRRRSLMMGISGTIKENPPHPVFGRRSLAFAEYLIALYRAAQDESIDAIAITLGTHSLSLAHLQELRAAMLACRASGKRVLASLSAPTNKNYYLATAADEIIAAPGAVLGLIGLRVEQSFYAGSLEQVGVTIDHERIGAFKSAPEMFTRRDPSPENQAMVDRLLDSLYAIFVRDIAVARRISETRARELIDAGPMSSEAAKDAGLVDRLLYPEDIPDKISDISRKKISLRDYIEEFVIRDNWKEEPTIAVVVAEGEITEDLTDSESASSESITPGRVDRALREALATPGLCGVTLRVNSPGGFATASDRIHKRLADAARETPIVASMAGVAASGGYFISAGAERVYLSPATITGSIGIFAMKPNLSGLYDKIDMGHALYTRGRNAAILSVSRGFTESERANLRTELGHLYGRFLRVVSDGRGLTSDSVDHIGQGRVWTGVEAVTLGLADSLGGLWDAARYLAQKQGIREFRVALYPRRRTLFSPSRIPFIGGVYSWATRVLGLSHPVETSFSALTSTSDLFKTRMPYDIVIE